MSLVDIRPYFRTAMESLNFREWADGFNTENIPNVILSRAFHIEQGSVSGALLNHGSTQVEVDVIIRFFIQGFDDSQEAVDVAVEEFEQILKTVLVPSGRLGETFKNVQLVATDFEPLSVSNDNAVIGAMNFLVVDEIEIRTT